MNMLTQKGYPTEQMNPRKAQREKIQAWAREGMDVEL